MKCIYKKICSGYDCQHTYVWEEMMENPESMGSRFDFFDSDEKKFILKDIFRVFGIPAEVQGPSDVVYGRREQCYYNSSTFVEGEMCKIELEWRQDGVIVFAYEPNHSEAIYSINYFAHDFDAEEVCYLVEEDFLVPYKGMLHVGRMYHDVFTEEAAALKYYDSMTLRERFGHSMKQLFVVSKEVINAEFYRLNRQAIRLMEETGETPDSPSFCIDVKEHIEALEFIKNAKKKEQT